MRLIVLGIGRAGGALALAAKTAGHELVGLVARPGVPIPAPLEPFRYEGVLPEADLAVVAARDSQIRSAAEELAGRLTGVSAVAHLSGFTSVDVLDDVFDLGVATGSLHPLQTLPNAEIGAKSLSGSFAAVTGSASALLSDFASTIGLHPFPLDDHHKPAYHAAASAAANLLTETLAVADDLLRSVGSSIVVTRPLVQAVISNIYSRGWQPSLTGPVARGDHKTVQGQIEAAAAVSPDLGTEYRLLVSALATRLGKGDLVS